MPFEIDLLERGYFPREVPPPFITTTLAKHTASVGSASLTALAGAKWWTASVRHNLARGGGLRRPLSIPNPIGFLRIASEIAAGWTNELEPLLSTAGLSASRPVLVGGPRSVQSVGIDTIELRRAEARRSSRVILYTDIQNFYPTIYTHSIAWALHTKAAAKSAAGNMALLGNRLDRAFSGAQEGQTIGIPIGTDASLIIAECLLAAIEKELFARMPATKGYRWIDDYELCFPTTGDAERALSLLVELLAGYQLTLNPRKTRISDLPEPQEAMGIWALRRWDFGTTARKQANDIVGYFDQLFRDISTDRGGTLAAYAVARLQSFNCDVQNWGLLQSFLFQILVAEPSCARQVVEHFAVQKLRGLSIDVAAFGAAAETIAIRHAPMGHGSEIAWILWASITQNIPLTDSTAAAVCKMDDNLVALLALHARASGLAPTALDVTAWSKLMSTDQLRTENWLVAYEASIQGWLPSAGASDHISADSFFNAMRTAGVSFYNLGASPLPKSKMVYGGGGPSRSVID
jgi:hypothetical protein